MPGLVGLVVTSSNRVRDPGQHLELPFTGWVVVLLRTPPQSGGSQATPETLASIRPSPGVLKPIGSKSGLLWDFGPFFGDETGVIHQPRGKIVPGSLEIPSFICSTRVSELPHQLRLATNPV